MTKSYFDRVPMRYRPMLEAALALIPETVKRAIEPRFLIGVSPHFVGLHHYNMAGTDAALAAQGRTYEDCAHACYTANTPDRKQTVVFPQPDLYGSQQVGTVIHEYGHMFDEATGWSIAAPVTTKYSRTNRQEAFAEAFETILYPPSGEWELFTEAEAMRPLRTAMGLL